MFKKMTVNGISKTVNSRVQFNQIGQINPTYVEKVFEFAYAMSFGDEGWHRRNRTGGLHNRKNGEIFANAFQGKISEYAIYQELNSNYRLEEPDLSVFGEGVWDDSDFIIKDKKISVKSTKSFGNLLLLEQDDWNSLGQYIPNLESSDGNYAVTILARIKPFCEDIMKKMCVLYSNQVNKDDIKKTIMKQNWVYDIPGFITQLDLVNIIKDEHVIFRGDMLNGKIPMDADNYYVQAGNMRKLNELNQFL